METYVDLVEDMVMASDLTVLGDPWQGVTICSSQLFGNIVVVKSDGTDLLQHLLEMFLDAVELSNCDLGCFRLRFEEFSGEFVFAAVDLLAV